MQSEGDSLWESFPRILKSQEGARRYINAFRAHFQELPSLSPQQMNTLQVCSLLVIPPPVGRTVPQGGFPSDLTELNLSGWADQVQDVAADLQALLPRLCLNLGTPAIALLQLLETATGVGFCHHCCHPRPRCTCTGASQLAPPTLWSQIVPSTPRATCIPITSASHGEGLTTDSPPVGSGAEGPSTTGSYAVDHEVTSPTTTGSSDSATLAPATPILWESAGNPLSAGGAAASQAQGERSHLQHPPDKAAAVGGQDADSHRRQKTHNRDNKTRPTSPGRGVRKRSSVRMINKQTPHQAPSRATRDAPRDSIPGSNVAAVPGLQGTP